MLRSAISAAVALSSGIALAVEVKPEINGTIDDGCLLDGDENACAFMGEGSTRTGAIPPSIYTGLISTNTDKNYITIQDLSVQHSAGYCIRLGVNSDHIVVKNNDLYFCGMPGLSSRADGTQTLMTGNAIFYTVLCSYKNRGQGDHNAPKPCRNSWPAAVGLGGTENHDAYTIAHDNDVAATYGEALGSYGVDYTWTIGNRWRGIRNGARLIDNSNHNLVESNVSWRFDTSGLDAIIGDNGYSGNPDWNTVGSQVTIEPRSFCPTNGNCPTNFNIIRNNIFANNDNSTTVKATNKANIGQPPNPNVNLTEELGVKIYGNTFIGALDLDNGTDEDYAKGEMNVVNNIVYSTSTSSVCGSYNSTGYETFRFSNNFFGANPSDSDCDGTGDQYGKPSLNRDADTYGESQWTISVGPTIADVVLSNGATGDDDGLDLNDNDITWLVSSEWDYFDDVTFPNGGGSLNGTNWRKELYYDFDGTARNATTPNMGADETN